MTNAKHDIDERYIANLCEFIQLNYNLNAVSITPAKRGYYGETWRVNTDSERYFVKLDYSNQHQTKYKNSLKVVDYLCKEGIDFVSSVYQTTSGELYGQFGTAVLAIFAWIDGENNESDETKAPEYDLLAKVYAKTKYGFDIPTMVFSNDMACDFFTRWRGLKSQAENKEAQRVFSIFERYSDRLNHYADRLQHFAELCEGDTSNFYFTHGDAGGNLLCGKDACYICDWDEVMYAPPERDAWVMCCREWAVKLFNDALRKNNVHYALRPERLGFYCYHTFFHYLVELLKGFTKNGLTQEIEDYFTCWIMERMDYAEAKLM